MQVRLEYPHAILLTAFQASLKIFKIFACHLKILKKVTKRLDFWRKLGLK